MREVQFGELSVNATFTFDSTKFIVIEQPQWSGRTQAMSERGRIVTFHGTDMVNV